MKSEDQREGGSYLSLHKNPRLLTAHCTLMCNMEGTRQLQLTLL